MRSSHSSACRRTLKYDNIKNDLQGSVQPLAVSSDARTPALQLGSLEEHQIVPAVGCAARLGGDMAGKVSKPKHSSVDGFVCEVSTCEKPDSIKRPHLFQSKTLNFKFSKATSAKL